MIRDSSSVRSPKAPTVGDLVFRLRACIGSFGWFAARLSAGLLLAGFPPGQFFLISGLFLLEAGLGAGFNLDLRFSHLL